MPLPKGHSKGFRFQAQSELGVSKKRVLSQSQRRALRAKMHELSIKNEVVRNAKQKQAMTERKTGAYLLEDLRGIGREHYELRMTDDALQLILKIMDKKPLTAKEIGEGRAIIDKAREIYGFSPQHHVSPIETKKERWNKKPTV